MGHELLDSVFGTMLKITFLCALVEEADRQRNLRDLKLGLYSTYGYNVTVKKWIMMSGHSVTKHSTQNEARI